MCTKQQHSFDSSWSAGLIILFFDGSNSPAMSHNFKSLWSTGKCYLQKVGKFVFTIFAKSQMSYNFNILCLIIFISLFTKLLLHSANWDCLIVSLFATFCSYDKMLSADCVCCPPNDTVQLATSRYVLVIESEIFVLFLMD